MLAASSLLALALLVGASYCQQYEAEEFKGDPSYPGTPVPGLYIPDGQCSAIINKSAARCTDLVLNVYAKVFDGQQPDIKISEDLENLLVYRKQNPFTGQCDGQVPVDYRLACGRQGRGKRAARAPRAARALPPAPPRPRV